MHDRRHARRAAAVWVSAALLALSVPASAQEDAAGGIEASASGIELEPILPEEESPQGVEAIAIVGEQLDVTDVQDEAQAITAFGAADLDKMNISNVDGLALNVPGLHVGQQGQNAIITLRGVGTENASLTGEPGVAFHVDGINYGRPAAARVAFFDVQAIEVRRGPQGLLGGKNSTSGAIHVVTNDPSHEYEVNGDVLFGNYDRVRSRGMVNIPLGEQLALRFAAFYEDRDGYLDNINFSDSRDPFDLDNFGIRTKLRFTPTDAVDIVLGYNYFKETGNGPQADIVPVLNENPCPGSGFVAPGFSSSMPVQAACRLGGGFDPVTNRFLGPIFHDPVPEETDPREIAADRSSAQDDRYWGFTGKVDIDVPEMPLLGETRLKLLGGYQRTETSFAWDFDSVDLAFFPLFSTSVVGEHSAELQWGGNLAERLDWQTSFFFMRQTGDSLNQSPSPDDPRSLDTEQTVENKSYGAAIHGAYHFSENLTFSLGGRWIKDVKKSWLLRRDVNRFEACIPRAQVENVGPGVEYGRQLDGSPPVVPECGLTERGTMWGARVEWRPLWDIGFFDDQLIYAGIDRGFKSGGFSSGGVGTYKPEQIWAYTLGTKSEFFDRRLQVNLEGFFYAYENMQLALLDGTKIRTENSDTRMWGWELELRSEPIAGLRLQGLVSFIDTETIDYFSLDTAALGSDFQKERLRERQERERRGLPFPGDARCISNVPGDFSLPLCSGLGDKDGLDDFSGNALSRSPKLKWNISAEYDVPIGRFGTLTPRVQFSWQDKTFYRVFNREFDKQPAYHKTDLKLVWTSVEERWEVEAFVNNIENEDVIQNILVGPRTFGSPPLAWYGEPRFYGVRVGFRY